MTFSCCSQSLLPATNVSSCRSQLRSAHTPACQVTSPLATMPFIHSPCHCLHTSAGSAPAAVCNHGLQLLQPVALQVAAICHIGAASKLLSPCRCLPPWFSAAAASCGQPPAETSTPAALPTMTFSCCSSLPVTTSISAPAAVCTLVQAQPLPLSATMVFSSCS